MAKKNGTRTRAEAKKLMWEYYRDNKANLPKWITGHREAILASLISGIDPDLSFLEITRSVEYDTPNKQVA